MTSRWLALLSVLTLSSLTAVGCAPPEAQSQEDEVGEEHDGTDDGQGLGNDDEPGDTTGTSTAALSRKAAVSKGACPTNARISQGFSSSHDGIDLANSRGTPIYAVAAGTVAISGPAQGYGQWIRIKHDDGSMTEYGHMDKRLVSTGQRVTAGQKIALMGSQGHSTGPHLHLRTYRSASSVGTGNGMNPVTYLRARGVTLPCKPGSSSSSAEPESVSASISSSGRTTVSVWKDADVMESTSNDGAFVVKAEADTTYAALCWKSGDEVSSDGYTNDRWVKITVDGKTGFISGIFLRGDKTGGVTTRCE